MVDFYVSSRNILITDGYTINHKMFKDILLRLKSDRCDVYKRSMWSLRCEWATHNVLYKMGLYRSHTKDVNLNYPMKWYMEALYIVFGTITYLFA